MDESVTDLGQSCLEARRLLAEPREGIAKRTSRQEPELLRPSLFDDQLKFSFGHRHD